MHLLSFLRFWTVLIFNLIYFEWRDTEDQQFRPLEGLGTNPTSL